MNSPFPSPPPWEELEALEVHELVRDYPELLVLLEKQGVPVREAGTGKLSSASFSGEDGVGELFQALAWRVGVEV